MPDSTRDGFRGSLRRLLRRGKSPETTAAELLPFIALGAIAHDQAYREGDIGWHGDAGGWSSHDAGAGWSGDSGSFSGGGFDGGGGFSG